jgi:hypothetical protein
MTPNNLKRPELAAFTRNAADAIAGGRLSQLPAEISEWLAAALSADSAELASCVTEQVAIRAASLATTRRGRSIHRRTLKHLQELRASMILAGCATEEFKAVNLQPPVRRRRRVVPKAPTNLTVKGDSSGTNLLRFEGNNRPNRVTFQIAVRAGKSRKYQIIDTCTGQRYKHEDVTPGVPHIYRVRAKAANGSLSDWSNEAAVYKR